MVEFTLKINKKQGTVYIPKVIRNAFGLRLKILPDNEAGVFYRETADLKRVVESLNIIIQDLKLRC